MAKQDYIRFAAKLALANNVNWQKVAYGLQRLFGKHIADLFICFLSDKLLAKEILKN